MSEARPVLFVLGLFMVILALGMVVPAIMDAINGDDGWQAFMWSSSATLFVGVSLVGGFRVRRFELGLRQTFLLTTLSWVALAAFAGLPFYWSGLGLSYADGYFEAMSGLTTTGATVMVGLDAMPKGVLLWRFLLHWLGGIGIIAMAVAVLPMLQVGGMQLFRAESSEKADKAVPRAGALAASILLVYTALTVALVLALWAAGMTLFEAICHAMAAISTGGFSTSDASTAHFASALIDLVLIAGMIAGALPFVLYVRALRGEIRALVADSQVLWFLAAVGFATLLLAVAFWWQKPVGFWHALHHASFNVVSVVTTTGFASTDYGQWGGMAVVVFFFLTFMGGCTGSTSGAIKVFRFEILFALVRVQLARLVRPHAVYPLRYGGKPLPRTVANSVLGFFFMYFAVFAAASVAMAFHGYDFLTSISGAAATLGNVGPGLGPIIGPVGNYSSLADTAKWVLSAAMLLGRLELFTVLVLFLPAFWRN